MDSSYNQHERAHDARNGVVGKGGGERHSSRFPFHPLILTFELKGDLGGVMQACRVVYTINEIVLLKGGNSIQESDSEADYCGPCIRTRLYNDMKS